MLIYKSFCPCRLRIEMTTGHLPFGFKYRQLNGKYRSGTLNSNKVNSKFHLIRSFFQILARILSFHV